MKKLFNLFEGGSKKVVSILQSKLPIMPLYFHLLSIIRALNNLQIVLTEGIKSEIQKVEHVMFFFVL